MDETTRRVIEEVKRQLRETPPFHPFTYTDAASRSAFVDFSQHGERKSMCFDGQGNIRTCDEDVIETTGRVVDDDRPKENAIESR